MNPLGPRSRVEELSRLLDGAVAGPGSATAGQAALALRLRALAPSLESQAAPRPEFRAALRQRLIAVATVQAGSTSVYAEPVARPTALDAAVSWTRSRKAQRRIGVTAGAMASVVALAGVGIASSQSLPGQPFYGLKRVGEGAQLDFASGDTAKGAKHLEFAKTRLREVQALAHGDGMLSLGEANTPVAGGSAAGHIVQTLSDFNSETRDGQDLLEKVYRSSGATEPLTILKSFASSQQARLTSLLPTLPGAARAQAQASLELVFSVGSSANELLALGTCGGDCNPGNGGPLLSTEPDPTPGATATPDSNGVPACQCAPSPAPAVAQDPSVTPAPTDSASPSPKLSLAATSSPSSSPTSSPSPSPSPSPSSLLPVPIPSGLPTIPPLPIPTGTPTALPLLPALAPLP